MSGEITSITHLDSTIPALFGTSPVSIETVGEGKKHKDARQAHKALDSFFSTAGVIHTIGLQYLQHQNHAVFPETSIGSDKPLYVGIKTVTVGESNIPTPQPGQVHIIGGMCMGGSETITGVDRDGNKHALLESDVPDTLTVPMKNLQYNPKPTLYEVDTIGRTTHFINTMLSNGMHADNTSVFWHVPLPEYTLYLKQYMDSGVLSAEQAQMLMGRLEQRAKVLTNWFTDKLHIKSVSVGSTLEQVIHPHVLFDQTCSLESVLAQLHSDPTWKSIIDNTQISSWTQLADASYTCMYLQQAAQTGGASQLVGVENPDEAKILSEAKKIATASNTPFSMTGLYPHPSYLENQATPARMYRHKSTQPAEVRLVFNSYQS